MDDCNGQSGDESRSPLEIQVPSFTQVRTCRSPRRSGASPPRLGAAHLLLWVTMVSVYFAIARSLLGDQKPGLVGLLILLGQAAVAGAAWSGLSITANRVCRHQSFAIEPGQWLLVVVGLRLLLEALLHFKPGELFSAPGAVVSVFTCCLLVLPTTDRRLSYPWKLLFGALVVMYSAPLMAAAGHVWLDVSLALPAEIAVSAVWLKLVFSLLMPLLLAGWMQYRGARSPWLHGVGIGVWSLWLLMQPRVLQLVL